MRNFFLATLLLSIPTLASAQTLTLAVDEAPPPPPPQAVAAPPAPAPTPPAPPAPAPSAPVVAQDDEEPELWSGFGIWTEGMDLRSLRLEMGDPEIRALDGLELTPDWAGNAPLAAHVVGGLMVNVGMRAVGFVRGPELRIYLGGGSVQDGPWMAAPGHDTLELQVGSSFVFRLETAFGVQAELGPVVPYLVARAAMGGAWIDVNVRDSRLGEIGTETVDGLLLELGLEAGIGLRPTEGVEVGFAFRGTFVGAPSYGGVVSVSFSSPDE